MNRISLKQIRIHQNALLRLHRRSKAVIRQGNIRRNNLPKPTTQKRINTPWYFDWEITTVPAEFNFSHIESVLAYINEIYKTSKQKLVTKIWMDMRSVTNIDIFCLCLLISQINKLRNRHIICYGNYPENPKQRNFISESGFLKLIKTNLRVSGTQSYFNQMYMIGKNSVDSDHILKSVKRCMKQLSGKEESYNPVFENMVEICANSVEHANQINEDKNWLVSISQESNGIIRFILTDTGEGMLRTLVKKRRDMFSDIANGRKDCDVLKRLFNGDYQSRTGETNLHLGLPEVYESFKAGFISNLQVLTNSVNYDFSTDGSTILSNEFMGVMITWTLSKTNIDIWKKSL